MEATAPPIDLGPQLRPARRIPLRAIGLLGILAVIVLATGMVAAALLFRGAVQSHLRQLEQANALHAHLVQQHEDAIRRGAAPVRLDALQAQLAAATAARELHLAATRDYIDGSTVTLASLAWLGVTSIGGLAMLFFSRLAADIASVRARALAILRGDRSRGTPLARRDELGGLARAVDDLAEALGRREQDLAVERRHVMHQEKLATIGAMAAGVIREIGNPIAAIDGHARAMLQARADAGLPCPLPPQACDPRPILHETQRLVAITREISGLAAAPAARWQLANVNEIVTHTLALLRYEPRMAGVQVTATLDPQLPAVMAYADRLVQMLINLLVNAADATASLAPRSARIAVATRAVAGGVELVVADNGCGMEPAVLARAFEPLFTTKPAGVGTGLGLPLCRSVVQAHGGRIGLEAPAAGGTRVTVWLPTDAVEPAKLGP